MYLYMLTLSFVVRILEMSLWMSKQRIEDRVTSTNRNTWIFGKKGHIVTFFFSIFFVHKTSEDKFYFTMIKRIKSSTKFVLQYFIWVASNFLRKLWIKIKPLKFKIFLCHTVYVVKKSIQRFMGLRKTNHFL